MDFKTSLLIDYPIPEELTVWGGNGVTTDPVVNLDTLIDTCVLELGSDILMTSYIEASGMVTTLPEDSVAVLYATLSSAFPFQGNRLIKCTFDPLKHIAYLRFFPATIAYYRKMHRSDLNNLTGDQFIYVKSYAHSKMADKELTILKSANLQVDNGAIDLSELEKFRDAAKSRYEALKPEILIYASST